MPKLTGKELGNIIQKFGFVYSHTTGSHMIFKHPDGRKTSIPHHSREDIGPGLLNKILKKELFISREELKKYLATIGQSINISDLLKIEPSKPQVKEIEENIIIKDKITYKAPEEKSLKEFGAISVKKNSRQSIIIGLLKRKKEIMIKDVSPLINGCSEKTIQRELSAMVHTGVLKRIGEKRWSRYSLARP